MIQIDSVELWWYQKSAVSFTGSTWIDHKKIAFPLRDTYWWVFLLFFLFALSVSYFVGFCHEQHSVILIQVVSTVRQIRHWTNDDIKNFFQLHHTSIMTETFHMVLFVSILLIGIFVQVSQALIPDAVGKFPFLMPNVHPYRVSKLIDYFIWEFCGEICSCLIDDSHYRTFAVFWW